MINLYPSSSSGVAGMNVKKTPALFLKILFMNPYFYTVWCIVLLSANIAFTQVPESYSSFHCISLYWKPSDAADDNECAVYYRIKDADKWKQGMSLWFDQNFYPSGVNHKHEYRGSLIDLIPDTEYEILLELKKTGTRYLFYQRTMSENFKIKKTIQMDSGIFHSRFIIKEGGSAEDGYVLYESPDKTHIIDLERKHKNCLEIADSFVIVRGFVLRGATENGVYIGNNMNHIVIEDCDISGWGTADSTSSYKGFGINHHSGVRSGSNVSNIIIQRNKIHDPFTDSNSWLENGHPKGPQGITFDMTKGFNIIRYNEIYSDMHHMYNDGMGNNGNNSYDGFPNRDSDIYCNIVSHCWDDAIEAEGSGTNVRIWGNFIDTTYTCFGVAGLSIGPQYVYRNIANYSQRGPKPIPKYFNGGLFFKVGKKSSLLAYSHGRMLFLHNTSLQPKSPAGWPDPTVGMGTGINFVAGAFADHVMSRNNILHTRKGSIVEVNKIPGNSFDYDLYSGSIPDIPVYEKHGIKGTPTYASSNKPGEYYLANFSRGLDAGLIIPNFSHIYTGKGPDMGAFEIGLPPIISGVNGDWNIWVDAKNVLDTLNMLDTVETYYQGSPNRGTEKLFALAPNPASEFVSLSFHNPEPVDIRLSVYDFLGHQIFACDYQTPLNQRTKLNTFNWKSGIYWITAQTGSGVFQSEVLIVLRE
jgi:hypothetical protein